VQPKSIISSLGTEIKERRTSRGLRQEELAHPAGADRNVVSRLECARQNVTVKTLFAIAVKPEVSMSAFSPAPRDGRSDDPYLSH
jgi:transcriptional regulator with XRE-family HTH domain